MKQGKGSFHLFDFFSMILIKQDKEANLGAYHKPSGLAFVRATLKVTLKSA